MLSFTHYFSARPAADAASHASFHARAMVGLGLLMLAAAPAGAAENKPSRETPRAKPAAQRPAEGSTSPQAARRSVGGLDTPPAPRDPFAPSDDEERPPLGKENMFNEMQIRYCLAQLARINAVRPLLDRYQTEQVKYFNAQVTDLNSRCSSYRYVGRALGDARAWLETSRAGIEQDARTAYTQRFAAEQVVVKGLDEAKPAAPPRPAPVERSPASPPAPEQASPATAQDAAKPAATAAIPPPPESPRAEEGHVSAAQRPARQDRSAVPAHEPAPSAPSQPTAAAEAPRPTPPGAVPTRPAPASAAAEASPATPPGAVPTRPAPAGAAAATSPATPPGAVPTTRPAPATAAAGPPAATPPSAVEPPPAPATAAAGPPTATSPGAGEPPPAQATAPTGPSPIAPSEAVQPPAVQTAALPPAPASEPPPQPRGAEAPTGIDAALERLTQDIQRESAQVLDQPPGASDKDADLTTQIELRYAAGGYIKSIVVGESCGSAVLDRQALELARALRYPEVPEALRSRDFAVRFPIVFRARR
jgi:hypothetical protein